jgi:two-component system sensor histidine kinase SenX3
MWLLLTIVGVVAAFALGWFAARVTGEPLVEPELAPAVEPAGAFAVADVVEEHPCGVVVHDAGGVVAYRNRMARSVTGTHVGVLLDAAIERHAAAARDGENTSETVEMYGPPKKVFDVDAHPLPDGGAVVFVQDISERRRVEQVRTDFVANISHELKTPVGAMAVLAETLEDEDDPAIVSRIVERMMSEAQRAARTIDDLMELSRIELGGERVFEWIDVADLVRRATDRVTELAGQREIGLSTLAPIDAGAETLCVWGDRRQLESALGNIVENAVKYSGEGSSVQIRARAEGDHVEISVADQGVGIPQRDLDRIFERFYRVDRARSRATGGTGLGLSIVRHVVNHHGGEVVVTSTEGEGSTFVLRLPAPPTAVRGEVDAAAEPTSSHSEGVA